MINLLSHSLSKSDKYKVILLFVSYLKPLSSKQIIHYHFKQRLKCYIVDA